MGDFPFRTMEIAQRVGLSPAPALPWRPAPHSVAGRQALAEGAVILAEDESHVNLLPWLRSTWIVKLERQEVMTPGKNQKRSIFGAIELATGRWLYSIVERATSAAFTDFLEQILDAYPKVHACLM